MRVTNQTDPLPVLDLEEQERNNVPSLFTKEVAMVRTVLQDALALTSLTLFLAAIAVWAQVLGVI
jgi:hypothetical protein